MDEDDLVFSNGQTNRAIEQSLEIRPQIYGHFIYDKSDTTEQWEKDFLKLIIMGQ